MQRTILEGRLNALEVTVTELRARLLQDGTEPSLESLVPEDQAEVESRGAARVAPEESIAPPEDSAKGTEGELPDLQPDLDQPATPAELPPLEPPPPPDATLPSNPPAVPRPRRPPIDWEQWIGVRGAAVLGGVVFALAGIYFVRYSIQAGWVPPAVRIAIGLLTGVGAVSAGEVLRKRGYTFAANGLAGAGVVLLYASVWAARSLYALFGTGVAFALMVLVTAAGGVLSWRHHSRVIALLGLVGGFATPLLISSGSDRPIGLFGYLMLLNVGVAFLARRTGWSFLAALALGGTILYQALWIFFRMDSERTWLGLLILGAFVLFYVGVGWLQRRRDPSTTSEDDPSALFPGAPASWTSALEALQQAGAVLTPFAFALYFAAQSDLGSHLWPLALLLGLLNLAAIFVAKIHQLPFVAPAAAGASLGVVVIWSLRNRFDTALAFELVAVLLGLAAIHHLALEWLERRAGEDRRVSAERAGSTTSESLWSERLELPPWSAIGAAVAAIGAVFWLLVLWMMLPHTADGGGHFWLAFFGALAGAALLARQSVLTRSPLQETLAATGIGLHVFAVVLLASTPESGRPGFSMAVVLALLTGAAFQAWGFWRRNGIATALVPAFALLGLFGWTSVATSARIVDELPTFHLGGLLLALLLVLAATRKRSGLGYAATMAFLAILQSVWTANFVQGTPQPAVVAGPGTGESSLAGALPALGLQLLAVLLFSFWPLLSKLDIAGMRRAAALAAPVWFLSLYHLYRSSFGLSTIGLLAIALGVVSLVAGFGMVRLGRQLAAGASASDSSADPRSTLAWYGGVTLGFVALAIPLQLDKEWITVAWALQGLAVTVLWKRVDHAGLKYFGLFLHAAVVARLIANPALFDYHSTGSEPFGLPVLNWLLYTYLVPAVALVLSARILAPLELSRLRESESPIYEPLRGQPAIAGLYGLASIAVVFVWINLTIFDAFAPGAQLAISFDRQPTRDLVLSLSWAVFAICLLMLGVARKSVALRWISLAFLLLTIGKVFLYDLGELTDLFRVASLVGLAISLIGVSLLYQRFVFGRDGRQDPKGPAAGPRPSPRAGEPSATRASGERE